MSVEKPSNAEDEYFAREDALKKQKIALDQQQQLAQTLKDEQKALHFMKCPKCGMDLHTIDFQGLRVDRCFNDGGTWLDKGELEKLMSPQHGAVMSSILNWFHTK
jgi:hypothetical protein